MESLQKRLATQREREKIPEIMARRDELAGHIQGLAEDLRQAEEELAGIRLQLKALRAKDKELAVELAQYIAEKSHREHDLAEKKKQIAGYKSRLQQLENELVLAEKSLHQAGLDEHAIAFISQDVADGLFRHPDGTEWTRERLQARLDDMNTQIHDFNLQFRDIDQMVIYMVEPQKDRVNGLRQQLEIAQQERQEWQNRLAEAEVELRNHIRETMEQYIQEFSDLASLLGAQAKGKLEQDGSNPELWKLHVYVGFNGKNPQPYYEPGLSSGERAVVSIMLLLAAVNNRKENQFTTLMFLDEPTARVDDGRANELGTLLQVTDIQYFITHQTSASLISVDWIDHAFVVSKLRPGEEFADDPIFEARRVVQLQAGSSS
ncbi:MAG: hypothetical protein M1553_01000 [Firmicutes bacterium]|nr:hypothetical protein [Bacillota bacterium]